MAINPDKENKDGDEREMASQTALSEHPARVAVPRWRARPDGDQRWIQLPVDRVGAVRLRRRAAEAGITVDAWLGIALAYEQVRTELPGEALLLRLRRALPLQPLRFGATDQLCGWQRYLLQGDGPGLRDELPEVVVGRGISAASAARVLPAALCLRSDEWRLGRECELRAVAAAVPLPDYIHTLARG